MTTNHPANGPVSLDRLHQISEILSKAAAQSDGGNLGYAMADAVKVIDGAIAAFDEKPVAYIFKHPSGRLFWALTDESNKGQSDVMPVYAAPRPAPLVPEWTNEQCLEFLSIAFRHTEIKGDLELDDIRLGMKMVNESRAAMLQAGNSPVTPDGYVLVPKKLTAENGAKSVLSGEFSETKFINCPECFGDDDCETCDGNGRIEITVPVTWTTIKAIWAKGVEHFAAAPQQENV